MQKKTLEILKNFSTINPGIVFRKGNVLKTCSIAKNILAVAKIPDQMPHDFAIYELNQFLNALAMFSNPQLKYNTDHILIEQGQTKIKYKYAAAAVVVTPNPSKGEEHYAIKNPLLQFKLSKDQLAQIIKSSVIMQLTTVSFDQNKIRLFNSKTRDGNEYILEINDVFVSDEFKQQQRKSFEVDIELLKLLPVDYTVKISPKMIQFSSEEGVDYFIAVAAPSNK